MKHNKVIIIVVALLLLAGLGYTQLNKPASPNSLDTESQKAEIKESIVTGTIKSLLKNGKNVKCSIDYSIQENGGKGTIYVAGKKMRGDFTVS
ncbi:hypothetical protein KKG52_00895 [Patescibacteria group bacterium]|nr:hypothetical protein [Patescibacteria group bacterium]